MNTEDIEELKSFEDNMTADGVEAANETAEAETAVIEAEIADEEAAEDITESGGDEADADDDDTEQAADKADEIKSEGVKTGYSTVESIMNEIISEAGLDRTAPRRKTTAGDTDEKKGAAEKNDDADGKGDEDSLKKKKSADGGDNDNKKRISEEAEKKKDADGENGGDEDGEKEPGIVVSKTAAAANVAAAAAKKSLSSVKKRIKNTEVLQPDVIKDMFFGTQPGYTEELSSVEPIQNEDDEDEPEVLFKKKKRSGKKDPDSDKMLFSTEYIVTPDQATEGYMLFYNEFVKKGNIKLSLIFGFISVMLLVAILISPDGYISYLLLLVTLAVIAIKWLGSMSAKREALASADDVKNDSYKLSFYNSRILLEASELAGDRIYNYPPVMIRFEDIDLRVIDYDEIYVMIFKKDYIYTVPKSALTDGMNRIFKGHLEKILGDDYYEFYKKRNK